MAGLGVLLSILLAAPEPAPALTVEAAVARTPTAIAVIGGVIVSTALSLLVVPCFHVVADRMKERTLRSLGRGTSAISGGGRGSEA